MNKNRFIEFTREQVNSYLTDSTCSIIETYAKKFINCRCGNIRGIDERIRDGVIIDSINFMSILKFLDYKMDINKLYNHQEDTNNIDVNIILNLLINNYSMYIKEGILQSLKRNKLNNGVNCNLQITNSDCVTVLTSFVNFIAGQNNIDKIFTPKDLIERRLVLEERRKKDHLKYISCFEEKKDIVQEKNEESNISGLNYIKLGFFPNNVMFAREWKQLKNLLTVWDEEHSLFVCNPAYLFQKPIDSSSKNIEWNNIDVKKMLRFRDFQYFISSNCKRAFPYIEDKLSSEMEKAKNKNMVGYCMAVLEKFPCNYNSEYIVRGIIKLDMNGYSVSFNPEYYEKAIPKSVCEELFRSSGHNTPKVYQLKRSEERVI